MTPQVVDLNADGHQDLVMATFEGTAFFVEGTEKGFQTPVHIVDGKGENVRISLYYDMKKNDYLNVDRSVENENNNEQHHMTSIALVDWDEDGDLDLVLGAYEGALYLCLNEGNEKEPSFSDTNLQIRADGEHVQIEGGLATPRICDWNNDGLFDILCGGGQGSVYWYRNTGKKGAPVFAAQETLIARTMKSDETSDTDDTNDYYSSMMVPTVDGMPACPGTSFHIETADYDGDGDLDLLVGGQSYFQKEKKTLTDEEKLELAEINKKMDEFDARFEKAMEGKDQDEMQEFFESDEFEKMEEEMSEIADRRDELSPSPEPAEFIWLYRNRDVESKTSTESESREPVNLDFDPDQFGVNASLLPASASSGDEVTLAVQIHIPDGFHIYGSRNAVAPTKIVITDDGGLVSSEEIEIPDGRIVFDSGKTAFWLEDIVTVNHALSVPDGFKSGTLKGHVAYMICDEQGCKPPTTAPFSASLNR